MGEELTGVNTEAASPPASDPSLEMGGDALGAPSAPESAAPASDKPKQTMEDVIREAYQKSTKEPSQEPKSEETVKKDDGVKEDALVPPEKKEETEKKPEDQTEEVPKQEEPKKEEAVPYERFQEVVAKRNEIEGRLKEVEPIAVQHQRILDYCNQNSISGEQFSQGLEILSLINSNPSEALKKLEPIVNELKGYTGDKLPQDLQAEVDGGDLSLTRAKEIAQLRAQQTALKTSGERQQKLMQQREEQQFQLSLSKAADSWETAKAKLDPDYKPKSKETDPDGKWELTKDRFLSLLHQQDAKGQYLNPIRHAQDLAALLEKAYLQINETFATLKKNGRPPTPKVLTRTGSSEVPPKSPMQAKSMDEAMRMAAAKHGIH